MGFILLKSILAAQSIRGKTLSRLETFAADLNIPFPTTEAQAEVVAQHIAIALHDCKLSTKQRGRYHAEYETRSAQYCKLSAVAFELDELMNKEHDVTGMMLDIDPILAQLGYEVKTIRGQQFVQEL